MANFKKFRLKRILVNSLPAFLVAGLVLSANLYFDLDLERVVMNEITRITQNLEVLTGQIIGANNEQLLLGTTNDLVEVVRGGQTYLVCDASGNCAGSFGYAFASGTTNYLAKFTSASSLGNSIVLDNGNLVSILGQLSSQGTTTLATSSGNVGIGTTTPLAKLHLINGTFLIDNPLNPIRVGNVDTGYTQSLYVSDKYAFVAAGYSNLHIVDISSPSNPTIISTYATSGYGLAVRVSGQYAYLANESGYFQIIDISNPSNPTWVATYNPGYATRNVYLSGKYAFVLAGAKIFVVDISNPKNPNLVGSYDFVSPLPRDIYVSGKYAFVAQDTAGLAILDISDPANPTHIQTYNTTGTAYGVYVSGRYAYVADDVAGLQIIDISKPANPTWVGNYNTPGSCGKVYVSGKYAFVADGAYGLQIIDVSNPANPTLVGNYNTPGYAFDVYVSGRYAYVADNDGGLQIIDIFGIDTHAANIGNIFSQNLTVSENVDIANNLYVRNGLNVGLGGIYSQGPISILSSTSSNTVSAFDVKNSEGTPLFYVRNDGNIGIGTTTPSSKLTVSGDLFVSSTSTLANVLPLADNLYNLGSPSLRWANIFAVTTTIGNTITIGTNTLQGSATTTLFTTGNSNQLVLGANGNVGIGTTNPISLLELYKENTSSILTITVATSTTTYDPYIAFRTGATPETRALIGIDYSDSNKLKIVPGSDISTSTGITVDASGRVGIGFEPSGAGFPVSELHVEGDITIAYGTAIVFNAYYDDDDRYLYSDSAFEIWHDVYQDILYFGAAPPGTSGNPITYNTALVIRSNGNVAIGGTTASTKLAVSGLTSSQPGRYICSDANGNFYYHTTACVSSSFKFKKEIEDLNLGLDALMNLRPVTFKFNENYGGNDQTTHMGFIAEEVEKITPLLVDYTDGQPTGVRYSEMTALLVKSVQEQQKQIEKMQLAVDEEGDLTYGGKKIVSSENQSLFEAIKKLIKQALSEIEKLFVKEISIERAEIEEAEIKKAIVNQICLRGEDGEEICLTKDQLKSLINNSFPSQNNNQVSETGNETNNETVCLPNWQCTDWQPPAEEICANEIFLQERTCTDLNNCATQEGKPIESQQAVGTKDCQNEK